MTPNNPFLGLGSYNSNGGRGRANNITLDNATSTDVSTTGGAGLGTVPLDAIKESTSSPISSTPSSAVIPVRSFRF